MTDRELTAFHEAGHAVAHWLLGLSLKRIRATPDHDSAGCVEGGRIPKATLDEFGAGGQLSLRSRDFLERSIQASLAGSIAARLLGHRGRRGDARYIGHPRGKRYIIAGDLHDVIDMLCRLCGDSDEASAERTALFNLLEVRTERLLRDNLALVKCLGVILLERGNLSGKEARQMLRRGRIWSRIEAQPELAPVLSYQGDR